MQWRWEVGGAGTYYWVQPIQQGPGTHLHWIGFSLITPISPAQCTSPPACPDLCTLYTLFLSFLCVKSCIYEDQSHFGHEATLTADIASPCSGFLLGWMNTAPAEWQYQSTWPHILRRLQSSSALLWQPQMTTQQMCIYKYAQSHAIHQQHFWTPPWPSSGILVTRIQLMYNNRTKMYDKTIQYYTQFFMTNLMNTKHEYCIKS